MAAFYSFAPILRIEVALRNDEAARGRFGPRAA